MTDPFNPSANAGRITMEYSEDLLPEGDIKLRCIGCEQTTSKNGDPMLKWQWVAAEGEHEGEVQFPSWSMLVGRGRFRTIEIALAMDLAKVGDDGKTRMDFAPAEALGKVVIGTIAHREYDGAMTHDLKKISRCPNGPKGGAL